MTENEKLRAMKRLKDYADASPEQVRAELVAEWQRAYPDAARERSEAFHPLIRHEDYRKRNPDEPDEQWYSDVYFVTLRRWPTDHVFKSGGGMIQLGISSLDGTARHDWRDFQQIKNQLAGPETESFELYPAESRLLDPSNYYTLWCFPGVRHLRIGMTHRDVKDADMAYAPQRALAMEAK